MTDPNKQDGETTPSDTSIGQENPTEEAQREAAEEREEEGGYQ